jgi:hypothetical protein
MPNVRNTLTPYSSVTSPFEVCAANQAAHYHIVCLKLGASSLTQHLAGYRVRKVASYFNSVGRVIVNVELGRLYELWWS